MMDDKSKNTRRMGLDVRQGGFSEFRKILEENNTPSLAKKYTQVLCGCLDIPDDIIDYLERPIDQSFDLSNSTWLALQQHNSRQRDKHEIRTVSDLASYTKKELGSFIGMGRKAVTELREKILLPKRLDYQPES